MCFMNAKIETAGSPANKNTDLDKITTSPKSGAEKFREGGKELYTLKEFWIWSVSDLVSNATRGRLAEFIVAKALNISTDVARDEWEPFDLKTTDEVKIEVKSAAYIQTWKQKRLSSIIFSTKPSRFWNADTGELEKAKKRHADVYVFALLAHDIKRTIDPLDLDQWKFYVASTNKLNGYTRSPGSITLKSLDKLSGGPVNYCELQSKVKLATIAPREENLAELHPSDGNHH